MKKVGSVNRNEFFFDWTVQQAQRQTQLAHTNLIEPLAVCMVVVNFVGASSSTRFVCQK